ncbi:MAG: tRNA glutamyl-Q(34) synthetase GluQRS [Cognatishimia sp.]|nr:tRNA glutamyl-Q(34) synthetase GluQRS [Cognatishimia sp.]
MTFRTRFAPSPTGPLHLGHAYSALIAAQEARARGGEFLLRIEDIDQSRSRTHWEEQIYDDLAWLGLSWPRPVMRQSERAEAYARAVAQLTDAGLTYPCICRRADIEAAAGAPQEGVPQIGPDGRIYPGTCRARAYPVSQDHAIRLNMAKAVEGLTELSFVERGALFAGAHRLDAARLIETVGDIILVRKGMAASYHLAVVVDDADQGITQVTRGADLWEATQIHVLLQRLLGLSTPAYYHHDLIRDDAGKRLAKRDDARAIATYRADGATPEDVIEMVGLTP